MIGQGFEAKEQCWREFRTKVVYGRSQGGDGVLDVLSQTEIPPRQPLDLLCVRERQAFDGRPSIVNHQPIAGQVHPGKGSSGAAAARSPSHEMKTCTDEQRQRERERSKREDQRSDREQWLGGAGAENVQEREVLEYVEGGVEPEYPRDSAANPVRAWGRPEQGPPHHEQSRGVVVDDVVEEVTAPGVGAETRALMSTM